MPPFRFRRNRQKEKPPAFAGGFLFGDPYGNRTHVTAVKGRCLNRLTTGPGSGNLIRTDDIPGMNRLLYQLSYAAILVLISDSRNSFLIISRESRFVKRFFLIFSKNFGDTFSGVKKFGNLEKKRTFLCGRLCICWT